MGKTILIADDSTSLRLVVQMTLEGAGHTVLQAADGPQALAWLDTQPVALIMADLDLPTSQPGGLLRQIRQHPSHASTPVVALSAPDAARSPLPATVCARIGKPFDPVQLLATIARHLQD